jgi:FkbM family methyltransferase
MELRFYGQFDPPLDRVLYERYFADREEPGVFVECGAFDGVTSATCKFFEETLGWRGINVEPSPPIFEELVKNRPASTNVNAALAGTAGLAVFHGVVHPQYGEKCSNGSLKHHPIHKAYIEKAGWEMKPYEVQTITWKDFVAAHHLMHIDLFVLDVEGCELDVVAGMKGSSVLPQVFCAEHGHLGVPALRAAIEPLGYRYDGSAEVNSFFVRQSRWQRLAGRLGWRRSNDRDATAGSAWTLGEHRQKECA